MSGVVRIAGYASRFDTPDRSGDIVRRGAFAGDLTKTLPLLWQHDAARPIGRVLKLNEDEHGLRMVAGIVPDTPQGSDALALLRAGALDGLSFGYRVRSGRPRRGGGRELNDVELIELSLVTFPMQPEARVIAVDNEKDDA